MFSGSSFTKLD